MKKDWCEILDASYTGKYTRHYFILGIDDLYKASCNAELTITVEELSKDYSEQYCCDRCNKTFKEYCK